MKMIRDFVRDESGIAMILVAVMLPVLIGFAVLAIDVSRANSLHNDLQKGADAMALAAAGELDGKSDSITRANRALLNLVRNKYSFSGTGGGPALDLAAAGVTTRYLSSLPHNDGDPIEDENVTTDPAAAQFVEIGVIPVGFDAIFPISFNTGNSSDNSFNISAAAVAGFSRSVCNFTPMFICNPYPNLSDLADTLKGTTRPMMLLKKQGGGANAKYGPGNYGYLQTPDGDMGTKEIAEMFASTAPKACYGQRGVDTRPGNIPPVNDGINTRFDIYGNGNGNSFDPTTYPPAPNTRKGLVATKKGKNCTYEAPSAGQAKNYKALPRDNCFYTNNCTIPDSTVASRLGNGQWKASDYWFVNHGTTTLPADLGASPSRYDVYKYEAANLGLASGPEKTTPECNTRTPDVNRRLIYAAILNCDPANGGSTVTGQGGNYPVEAFASIFLTEPAGDPPDADVYGEIVDISSQWGRGSLNKFQRDEAQLYR